VVPLVDSLRRRPTSIALIGHDRMLLTRVAVGLSMRLNPSFIWFDIRSKSSELPPWQSALVADFPGQRIQSIDIDEMKLDEAAGNAAAAVLVRGNPPDTSFITLSDLMRLPESLREAALENAPDSAPRVVLITNAERASTAFAGAPGALRPYIEALNRFGVSIVVTAFGPARENRRDCDLVLLVEQSREGNRVPSRVVSESVRSSELFPGIPTGASYAASSLEHVVGHGHPVGA
jgi:hypothetical protein